jgi:hypothetical protein
MASILTSPGFADERIDLYIAEATEAPRAAPTEAGIETVLMPMAEALQAVRAGTIIDAKTVAGLLLGAQRSRP